MTCSALRLTAPVAVAVLLTAAGALLAPAAHAAPLPPTVTVTPSAAGPVSGAANATKATVTITVKVADAPAADAVLTASVPGEVDGDNVRVDGTTASAGTTDTSAKGTSTDITVRLGAGADALVGGTLAPGTHTVTLTTDLRSLGDASPAVTATLRYVGGGGGASGTTRIPLPDLRVSPDPDFGPQRTLDVAPDGNAFYFADVTPRGGSVSASELTVTIPTGLAVDGSDGIVRLSDDDKDDGELHCTRAGATLRCPLGKITETTYVAIALRATSAAKPGTSGLLVITARAANGLDATPADNTARATVDFVPPVHLRTRLTAEHTSVEIGDKAHVTVSVTNTGTAPADVLGITLVVDRLSQLDDDDVPNVRHFKITGFSGRQGVPSTIAPEAGGSGASDPVVAARAMTKAAKRTDPDDILRFWNIGTLAPGATARAVLTLEAERPGRGVVAAIATGSLSGPTCLLQNSDDPTSCSEYDQLTLHAVAGAGTSGNDAIAATGFATTQWTGVALGLLLLGALSQYAGGRRLRVGGRHRG